MNRLGGGKKGKAMGTFAIGGSSGFAFGPSICGRHRLYSRCTWSSSFHRSRYYYIYRSIPTHATYRSSCPNYRPSCSHRKSNSCGSASENYWKYFGILFIIILSQSVNFRVINAFIPVFWTHELGTSPEQGSFALTVFFSIGIFMTYIGGLLGDKYGPIKIIRLSLLIWFAIHVPINTSP